MREQFKHNAVRDIHRINTLRERIAERAYEVDARQIADKFIHLEQALCATGALPDILTPVIN